MQGVRRAGRADPGGLQGAPGRGPSHRAPPRLGPAPDPPLVAGSGRGPARGQAVHREGQGIGRWRQSDAAVLARPGGDAGRARRARRLARRPDGGGRARGPPGGHCLSRPPGLRQDDVCRQARPPLEIARALSAPRGGGPVAPGRGFPAQGSGQADRRARVRSWQPGRSGRGRARGRQRGEDDRPRHGDRRHRRPASPRRGAHAGSSRRRGRCFARGNSLCGGRHDRPGRRAVGRGLCRGAAP